MKDERLLEPEISYRDYLKQECYDNANEFFDNLAVKSNIDIEENRKTVKLYDDACLDLENIQKKINKKKTLKGFLIFFVVVLIITAIVLLAEKYGNYELEELPDWAMVLITIVDILIDVGLILFIVKITKVIKALLIDKSEFEKKCKKYLNECWQQMAPLNNLFDSGFTRYIIEKTCNDITLDKNFTQGRFTYLQKKYGFSNHTDPESSVIGLISGEINHNPFVEYKTLNHSMGTETYTGSITIHWTTTSYVDGKAVTQHHSEVLTASVTKPKPFYSTTTTLVYGNEMADKLNFFRSPNHIERMDDKELQRFIKKKTKELYKIEKKQLLDNDDSTNLTAMNNSDFDCLFGAFDRDNEVEFRLMFTPLAQRGIMNLMKSDVGFGDDFYFTKRGPLNYINSEHSQTWDLNDDYERYYSHSFDISKRKFINYNCNYFKNLFFDLAPLLSICTYQDELPHEYIYKDVYDRNYTDYETEFIANSIGGDNFKNKLASTSAILKTRLMNKNGKADRVIVNAFAYQTIERIDYINKMGGDGHMHTIPVHWIEYIPVYEEKVMSLKEFDMTEKTFESDDKTSNARQRLKNIALKYVFKHGIIGALLSDSNYNKFDEEVKILE